MAVGIGIDLGTTYSCVIHLDSQGTETLVESADGGELTPSVVYFAPDGGVTVGQRARAMIPREPDNVVSGIKRQMGRDFPLEFGGRRFTPEGISGILLRHLVLDASATLSVDVAQLAAVITVPAYFGVAEKEATSAAAEIAGLTCLELLAEPVAAAYAYGLSNEPDVTSVVFDLGGGTFDVAVVGMRRGQPRVWAVDGETRLGGLDWDARIEQLLWAQVEALPDADDLRYDDDMVGAVTSSSERFKRQLTGRDVATDRLRVGGRTFELTVTRAAFVESTRDLVLHCMEAIDRVVSAAAGSGAPAVGQVLLVGGGTRMPMIRDGLVAHLGIPVKLADPDKAVARGAAILAAQLTEAPRRLGPGMTETGTTLSELQRITSVLPRALGLLTHSSTDPLHEEPYIHHFLLANTQLPVVRQAHTVATVARNQERARILLYEQGGVAMSIEPSDNRVVLDGEIVGIPPQPAGSPLTLYVSVDLQGRISVAASNGRTLEPLTVEAFIHGVLDDTEVVEQREVVSGLRLQR
jgi:molecular chaperone DnaK